MSATPSQRTNELLERLERAAAGEEPADPVVAELEGRLAELETALAEFRQGAQAPDVPQEPAARVLAGFERYREALLASREALQGVDPARVREAARQLAEAGTELHGALQHYEWAWVTSGETPYPLLNLLYRLRDLLDDTTKDAARAAAWSSAVLRQAAADLSRDPRLADLAAAFEHAGAWAGGADMKDPAARAQAAEEVQRVCSALESTLLHEWARPAPAGSWLEATLISGRMLVRGEVPEPLFLEALDALETRMVTAYTRFEGEASRAGAASPLVQDEVARARDRFALLNEGIENARRATGDPAALEAALSGIESSARALFESQMAFEEADRRQGLVACPRCGHDNPAGARVCSACAAQLPRVSGPEAADLPESGQVRSEHLLELLQACEKVVTGEISPEQFAGYLRWGFDLAARAREQLAQVPLDFDSVQVMAARLAEALDEFEQGLEDLSSYVGGGGIQYYESGTRRLLRGGQKLEAVRDESSES